MVLDDLLRAVPMIFEHRSMRRQNQFDIELLHFLLRIKKIPQRVVRPKMIHADMRSNLWQQMVANDQHFVGREVETAVPGSVSRRPHHDELTVADANGLPIVERMIRQYWRVQGAEIASRRRLPIR